MRRPAAEGLVVPDAHRASHAEGRDDPDSAGEHVRRHVAGSPGRRVIDAPSRG